MGYNGVPTVSDEVQEIVKNQVSEIYLENEGRFKILKAHLRKT